VKVSTSDKLFDLSARFATLQLSHTRLKERRRTHPSFHSWDWTRRKNDSSNSSVSDVSPRFVPVLRSFSYLPHLLTSQQVNWSSELNVKYWSRGSRRKRNENYWKKSEDRVSGRSAPIR